jgi:hypothetical protein
VVTTDSQHAMPVYQAVSISKYLRDTQNGKENKDGIAAVLVVRRGLIYAEPTLESTGVYT